MLLKDPSDDILVDLHPEGMVISWAIFKHPNLRFCRFIATTASISSFSGPLGPGFLRPFAPSSRYLHLTSVS